MTVLSIFLQAATGSGMSSILMMVALIAIFYFFMIRPQTKRQKEIRKFRESLTTGDKIVTAGGLIRFFYYRNSREYSCSYCQRFCLSFCCRS